MFWFFWFCAVSPSSDERIRNLCCGNAVLRGARTPNLCCSLQAMARARMQSSYSSACSLKARYPKSKLAPTCLHTTHLTEPIARASTFWLCFPSLRSTRCARACVVCVLGAAIHCFCLRAVSCVFDVCADFREHKNILRSACVLLVFCCVLISCACRCQHV